MPIKKKSAKVQIKKRRKIITKESLDNLIKSELAEGHNIQEIKTDLVQQGFDEDLVRKGANTYFLRNYLITSMFVLIIVAIPLLLFSGTSITGHVTMEQIQKATVNPLLTIYPFIAISMLVVLFMYMKSKKT